MGRSRTSDVIAVVIETYVLAEGLNSRLVVSDTKGLPPDPSTMPLGRGPSARRLGAARRSQEPQGHRRLDGSHEARRRLGCKKSEVVEWVRTLRNQYKVITVVATTRKPIRDRYVALHRPLAESILDSIRWTGIQPDNALMSLADFRQAIIAKVRNLTKESGEPAVYIPEGTNSGSPILNRKLREVGSRGGLSPDPPSMSPSALRHPRTRRLPRRSCRRWASRGAPRTRHA